MKGTCLARKVQTRLPLFVHQTFRLPGSGRNGPTARNRYLAIPSHYQSTYAVTPPLDHTRPARYARVNMSAHDTLDDDLQHPPPSAQRAAWPADVRRGGTTGRRPIARRQRDVHQPMVASNAAETSSTLSTWSENDPVVIDSIPNTCTVVACTTPDGCMPLHHNTMPAATGTSRHHNALRQPALPAASPRFFDAWNSSSTGHQRAENRLSGSTSWRQSRNQKLGEQYKGGLTGGKRVSDTVGAGSDHHGKEGRKANGGWERGAKAQKSLVEFWGGSNNKVVMSGKPDIPRNPDEEDAPAQEVTKGMLYSTLLS